MTNCLIVSGKGFLTNILIKPYDRNTGIKEPDEIIWSQNVRNSTFFSRSSAVKIIDKYSLDAFIWKPYEEVAGEKGWRVLNKNEDIFNSKEPKIWVAVPGFRIKDTDIAFLNRKGGDIKDKPLTKEDAIKKAMELNDKEFEKVTKHIMDLNNANEELMEVSENGNS